MTELERDLKKVKKMDKLVYKDGKASIFLTDYQRKYPFELRIDSLYYGDPVYGYATLRGAKIALAKMRKKQLKGI